MVDDKPIGGLVLWLPDYELPVERENRLGILHPKIKPIIHSGIQFMRFSAVLAVSASPYLFQFKAIYWKENNKENYCVLGAESTY